MNLPPFRRAAFFAAALTLAFAAVPAAQAFQFEGADGASVTPPRNFMDLGTPSATDKPASNFDDSKKTTLENGNFSVQFEQNPFGGGSFNHRYNFNAQFDRYNPGH